MRALGLGGEGLSALGGDDVLDLPQRLVNDGVFHYLVVASAAHFSPN
jgi:hypothetical protein